MKENRVKRALNQGSAAIGTMVFEFDSTGIARLAADAGAEFVIFDMEHTGWSEETIRKLIATTPLSKLIPMVRIPTTQYHFVARLLDIGAMGIMVPMVESPDQARRIVEYAKYPPLGRRGAAFGLSHDDYRGGDIVSTMKSANQEQLLIAQIETRQGLETVDEIAAVPGIDVLWIGHFDLSNSLGIPGQFDHPDFGRAVDRVLEACLSHEKIAGFMVAAVEDGKTMLSRGFRMIAYGGDLWIYQDALRQALVDLGASIALRKTPREPAR